MSDHATTWFQGYRPLPFPRLWQVVARRVAWMRDARRTRLILAEMDPHLLKDIGISRADAQAEVARAAWDVDPWDIDLRRF